MTDITSDPEFAPDVVAATALEKKLQDEIARLKTMGQKVLPLKVKNTGLMKRIENSKPVYFNRVEFDTTFDFASVQQILVAPPAPAEGRPEGYVSTCVVLLIKGKALPMIFGYIVDQSNEYASNALDHWLLVNKDGKETSIVLTDMQDI